MQGSAAILDWSEWASGDASRTLRPDTPEAEWRALEQRLDELSGVHVRRYYYSEAIVEHPETVRPLFERDLVGEQRDALAATWAVVPTVMTERMDLGREQQRDSRRILEGELDWLDGQLADGRRYLAGERFSRVDLTAASLLAPLALPPEHPTYADLPLPPRVAVDVARWADRPIARWVAAMYREHRRAAPGP